MDDKIDIYSPNRTPMCFPSSISPATKTYILHRFQPRASKWKLPNLRELADGHDIGGFSHFWIS